MNIDLYKLIVLHITDLLTYYKTMLGEKCKNIDTSLRFAKIYNIICVKFILQYSLTRLCVPFFRDKWNFKSKLERNYKSALMMNG